MTEPNARAELLAEIEQCATGEWDIIVERASGIVNVSTLLTRAAAEIRALEGLLYSAREALRHYDLQITQYTTELPALREDRERLDWLEAEAEKRQCWSQCQRIKENSLAYEKGERRRWYVGGQGLSGNLRGHPTLRDAIDAAIQQAGQRPEGEGK